MSGGDTVQLLVNLCAPTRIDTKSFDELVTLLDSHFSVRNEVAEAYIFDTRVQGKAESITEFVVSLKQLSLYCNFGPDAQLKQKLRNRLVAGVHSEQIRTALIQEGPQLTFDRAVELATRMDMYATSTMAHQAKSSAANSSSAEVHEVYATTQNSSRRSSQTATQAKPRLNRTLNVNTVVVPTIPLTLVNLNKLNVTMW